METLTIDRADGVVTVTLNRPERKNAINGPMWDELLATFDEVTRNNSDRVLVLTGAGDAFCSGQDLGAVDQTEHGLVRMRHVGHVALALHRVPEPTIAKANEVP